MFSAVGKASSQNVDFLTLRGAVWSVVDRLRAPPRRDPVGRRTASVLALAPTKTFFQAATQETAWTNGRALSAISGPSVRNPMRLTDARRRRPEHLTAPPGKAAASRAAAMLLRGGRRGRDKTRARSPAQEGSRLIAFVSAPEPPAVQAGGNQAAPAAVYWREEGAPAPTDRRAPRRHHALPPPCGRCSCGRSTPAVGVLCT